MVRAVVIGAGVAGLGAALELRKAGADVIVVDQGDAAGGVLRSHAERGYLFEDGPMSVLDSQGTFVDLCRDLGIEDAVVGSREDAKIRYLFHDGSPRKVPSGPGDLFGSPLVTFLEATRIAREAFIGPFEGDGEESVTAFLARRFGKSVTARYASALVSGVFGGDPGRLSLDAAFPELRAMEREHGSILRAAAAKAKERRASGGRGMLSLRGGLGRLGEAARSTLGGDLRLGTRVDALARRPGGGVLISTSYADRTEAVEADVAVVATGAQAAARVVAGVAPSAAEQIAAIEHTSVVLVQAGFRRSDLPGLPPGFGFLVPRGEGLESLGWIFLSQIFDGRAPEGGVALAGFFGGALAPKALAMDDRGIGEMAVSEIGRAIGVAAPPADFLRVVRWREVFPQYNLGHRERVERVTEALRRDAPEIVLAGNYLTGISIPRALASGRAAAAAIAGPRGVVAP
jgi:oxygen-dependent protoporphyrinogen oxidase